MMSPLGLLATIAIIAVLGVPVAADAGGARDLQAMIDGTPDGGALDLPPGTYAGPVVIDHPMTVTGSADAVVDAFGTGSVITITAPDVTIHGITVRGSGDHLDREHAGITSMEAPRVTVTDTTLEDVLFGVFLRASPDSVVSGNTIGAKDLDIARRGDGIRLWESEQSLVEGNTITGGRDLVFWFTDRIIVRDNVATEGRYGLHFMYSDGAVVEGNILSHNSVGAFLMYSRNLTLRGNILTDNHGPSGYGIGLKDVDDVVVEGNRLVANRVGIYFDNSPSSVGSTGMVTDNLIAYNQVGALFLPSTERNVFTRNTFVDNSEQVGITGTGHFENNAWSHDGVGNFWTDYAGYDADGDGIGDVAYRVDDLYDTLTDRHPELRFFVETPAAKSVDLAARMFPVLRPHPLVEDVHPLVDRPALLPLRAEAPTAGATPMLVVSGALLATAFAIGRYPRARHRRRSRMTPA